MTLAVHVPIYANKEQIWEILIDVGQFATILSAVNESKILISPIKGVIGLKWCEKRTYFGDEITEVKCITNAKTLCSYDFQIEDHDETATAIMSLEEKRNYCVLTLKLTYHTENLITIFLTLISDLFFRSTTKKALLRDLIDIKKAAEQMGSFITTADSSITV